MNRVSITHRIIILFLGIVAASVLPSCKETSSGNSDSFDRRILLRNVAQNIALPSFTKASNSVERMYSAIEALTATPSLSALEQARTSWMEAYSLWQPCQLFNFGPAESSTGSLTENIGTFPISTAKIENYITKADTSFRNFDRDSRGFLCIEYLLFSGEATQIIAALNNSPSRCAYLRSVARDVKTRLSDVKVAWSIHFALDFATDNSTSTGSSISELFNEFNKSFENLKNFKVALPLGLRAGQASSEPTKVEAYYSNQSRLFLELHLQAIESVWLGRSISNSEKDSVGFEEYLNAIPGGTRLVEDTKVQLAAVHSAFERIPANASLSHLAQSNDKDFIALHTELQKLTRFFKSEMSSLMGIAITYASGDGD